MHLNIVTLNIPYPPDYGGMIDTYYRLEALQKLGISIHLHCFEYGRIRSNELKSLCKTVSYHKRKSDFMQHFSLLPFTVFSRRCGSLLANLLKNDYPILFDGLHTTYYINHPALSDRKKLIRLHNIEHIYYHTLAVNESNLVKKLFYTVESFKLKRFEKTIASADCLFPISLSEEKYFKTEYGNTEYIPPFHPYYKVISSPGRGSFILYHGDMSVNENSLIAESLILNVFSRLPFSCVVAGKNPPERLLSLAAGKANLRIISNPGNEEMSDLIRNAHIHLLPALASNGFKIKLLATLFAGRHCITNSVIADICSPGSQFHLADSNQEIIDKIHLLMNNEFTQDMITERQILLSEEFDNNTNAKKMIGLIFNDGKV